MRNVFLNRGEPQEGGWKGASEDGRAEHVSNCKGEGGSFAVGGWWNRMQRAFGQRATCRESRISVREGEGASLDG